MSAFMIEFTTPDTVARIVQEYADRPGTLLPLLKHIHDKAMIPETKAAAMAALTAHYTQKETS